jgi:hypothetical protein
MASHKPAHSPALQAATGERSLVHLYWHVFLTGFCYRLLLPLSLLLIVGLVLGEVGKGFGAPLLILQSGAPVRQFFVGLALGVIWMQCMVLGYLLYSRNRANPQLGYGSIGYAVRITGCFLGTSAAVWVILWVAVLLAHTADGTLVEKVGKMGGDISSFPEFLSERAVLFVGMLAAGLLTVLLRGLSPGIDSVRGRLALRVDGKKPKDDKKPAEDDKKPKDEPKEDKKDDKKEPPKEEPKADPNRSLPPEPVNDKAPEDEAKEEVKKDDKKEPSWRRFSLPILMLVLGAVVYVVWAGIAHWFPTLVSFAIVFFLLFAVSVLLLYFAAPVTRRVRVREVDPLERITAFSLFFVGGIILILASYCKPSASPVLVLCVPWLVLVGGYGFIAYVLDRLLPAVLLVGLILLFLGGIQPRKYRIPGLEDLYKRELLCPLPPEVKPTPLAAEGTSSAKVWLKNEDTELLPLYKVFPGWYSGKRERDERTGELVTKPKPAERRPVVVVAASGGGLRAAVWTQAILQRLEFEFRNKKVKFPAHVVVITGASGGMLGASYYTAVLPTASLDSKDRLEQLKGQFHSLATTDFLTPLTQELAFRDLPLFFSPWPRKYDRGMTLEDAWTGMKYGNSLNVSFHDLKKHEQEGNCPSLIFSPMVVDDGRRLLISNLDLSYVASNDGNLLRDTKQVGETGSENYSREALEFFRLFPTTQKQFRLATAVRLSASFAYFSPATYLPTNPPRRIVDAGYYDNDGTSVAASFLFSGMNRQWFEEFASGLVLIQIRDTGTEQERRLLPPTPDQEKPEISFLERSLQQLTTPPEGLWQMRIASTSFRNDGLLELLSQVSNDREMAHLLLSQDEEKLRKKVEALTANLKKKDDIGFQAAQVQELLAQLATQPQRKQKERRFTVVTFEFPKGNDVSLSWSLTDKEQKRIRDASGWDPYEKNPLVSTEESKATDAAIDALMTWWTIHDPQGRN